MCIETIKNDPNLPNVLNGVRMSLLRRAEKCINGWRTFRTIYVNKQHFIGKFISRGTDTSCLKQRRI